MKKNISNIGSPKTTKLMALHTTYEVRWKNFKGFKDTGWIKIKPITIIIGPNNSGKTNFVAPLLLMSQTLNSRDSYSPLLVRGRLYDGGNVNEIINNYELTKEFSFGFKYQIAKPKKILKNVGFYPPGSIEVSFKVNNVKDRELSVISEEINDVFDRPFFKLSKTSDDKYDLTGFDIQKMTIQEQNAIKKLNPVNFLFSPNALLAGMETKNEDKDKNKALSPQFSSLLKATSYNFTMARMILGEISYIGPIRDNPHRYYEVKNEIHNTVGPRGENMPDILKKRKTEIKTGLNKWVKKFGFGDSLEIKIITNTLCSLRFHRKGEKIHTNIANAGFGASQILPLITQALVSPPGSLIIAEQPEIHLNPKLQCVLADLFAYMANKDQRIIVESHSEHLLLRLRTLIADKTINSDLIAVYYIDKKDEISTIKEIKIEADGNISPEEWPDDFFDDILRESFKLASQQAKNRTK